MNGMGKAKVSFMQTSQAWDDFNGAGVEDIKACFDAGRVNLNEEEGGVGAKV